MKRRHAMPFGTSLTDGGARFRLWAPAANSVSLRLVATAAEIAMIRDAQGWCEAFVPGIGADALYQFVIDGKQAVPDPASRYQPQNVSGPSAIVDPEEFDWTDAAWRGRPWHEAVIYELHLGAFTREGTYRAAMRELPRLARLGITAIELMPLADFAGSRNWGYDGVLPFAPDGSYGRPEELKAFIAEAHLLGLMVLIDVVYNHFGPEGNYLSLYAPDFFARHDTDWGQALDFDGIARQFFIENALYWLGEYHVDGLRLDAVHAIADKAMPDFLEELATKARAACAGRQIHLVVENDRNEARYLERDAGGNPVLYDAQWNDDFHHAMHVVLTGETEGYYADYAVAPIEKLGRALSQGFGYQGEVSSYRNAPRGEASAHLPPLAFVNFLQNHDQIGNRAFGERLTRLAAREALIAATTILLLAPSPPLLFMGEEVGAKEPFLFFCDFAGDLADSVREGRRREFARFAAFAAPEARKRIPDPTAVETFVLSRIDHAIAAPDIEIAALYETLLGLRHREIMPRLDGPHAFSATCETRDRAITARWMLADGSKLSLIANLSNRPCVTPWPLAGRSIWGPSTTDHESLPPWAVCWSIGN